MKDLLVSLGLVVRGMLRFRYPALLMTWVLLLTGSIAVLLLPSEYRASAKIIVNTETQLLDIAKRFLSPTDMPSELALMTEAVISRPKLLLAAQETGMNLRAESADQEEMLIKSMRERLTLRPDDRNVYLVAFRDHDRVMAYKVVKSLLDSLLLSTRAKGKDDASNATEFLTSQIAYYEQKLVEAEDRLAEFKRANVGLMPGERGDYYSRLEALNTALDQERAKVRLVATRRDALRRQMEGEEPALFGLDPNSGGNGESDSPQIAAYEAQLDGLLLEYTEKHPDVLRLRSLIEQLKSQQRAQPPKPASLMPESLVQTGPKLDRNPVYQTMKLQLSRAEVELAERQQKVVDLQRETEKLKGMVDTIPEVEAELAQLNRDYEVNRKQHGALLSELENARLSEGVRDSMLSLDISIIEPPLVPISPIGPNRPLFLAVVFVAALAGGIGLAFVLHQLNPVFLSRREVREELGLPVLGAVGRVRSARDISRERMLSTAWALGCVCLVLVFGASMQFLDYGVSLLHKQGSRTPEVVMESQ